MIYIGLGGGGDANLNDYYERIVAKAASRPDWHFVYSVAPLLRGPMPPARPNLHFVKYFPLAEVWHAFDGAITLRGANTTAELLHNGIPTIFLPPRGSLFDNQAGRGQRIMKAEAGFVAASLDDAELDAAFAALGDPAWRKKISINARKMIPENGAEFAAEFLLDFASKNVVHD